MTLSPGINAVNYAHCSKLRYLSLVSFDSSLNIDTPKPIDCSLYRIIPVRLKPQSAERLMYYWSICLILDKTVYEYRTCAYRQNHCEYSPNSITTVTEFGNIFSDTYQVKALHYSCREVRAGDDKTWQLLIFCRDDFGFPNPWSLVGQAAVHTSTYHAVLAVECGRQNLRSASDRTCFLPRIHNTFGDRSFSVAGPRVWNSLPADLRLEMQFGAFKRQLKTVLFGR